MLILTRRVSEKIKIEIDKKNLEKLDSFEIEFAVLGVKGHQVRLGISAPKEIPIHREEIAERIKQHKLRSSDENERQETEKHMQEEQRRAVFRKVKQGY